MADKRRIEGSLVRDFGTLEEASAVLLGRFNKLLHAAEYCRVGPKQLSAYANPGSPGRYMPVDVVRDLESAAGDPVMTRSLAAHQMHVLFRIPDAYAHGFWDRHQREIVKEGSDVFVMLTEALEDARMARQEAAALLVEVDQALAAFAALRNSLKKRVDGLGARSAAGKPAGRKTRRSQDPAKRRRAGPTVTRTPGGRGAPRDFGIRR